ncbi:MAG: hypothetical protein KAW67_03580 [Candidatus Eisenbacteria sp.]|nr:hypothetical protein [Candidatus Eisenbacteria bacterium]
MWLDNDSRDGELGGDDYTTVSVDLTGATQLYGIRIYWCLKGDIWGDPPHEVCGRIDLQVAPVEESSCAGTGRRTRRDIPRSAVPQVTAFLFAGPARGSRGSARRTARP